MKSVVVTPDEQTLVTAGVNHVVRVWSLQAGGVSIRKLIGHRTRRDESRARTVQARARVDRHGGSARLWDLRDGEPLSELIGHTNHVTGAAFDRKEAHVLTWSKDGTARVWNVDDGNALGVLATGRSRVTSAVFGPTAS